MKILVTGATGFLGKYIIEELTQHDHHIIAIGRNEIKGKLLQSDRVTFVKIDFSNWEELEQLESNIDAVIHAGALSTIWGRWNDFYQANVIGTKNIIRFCLQRNIIKLVYVSTPSIYTEFRNRFDIKEDEYDENNKLNYYIQTKLMAEKLITNIDMPTLKTIILRPRGLIGIGDTSVIPRIMKLQQSRGIPLVNDGKNLVDITCVENVAYAIRLSVENQSLTKKIYNVTNGEPTPFKTIVERLFSEIGVTPNYFHAKAASLIRISILIETIYKLFRIKREPIITKYTAATASFGQTLNIDKIKKDLSYKPLITLEEGIKKYAKHYKQNH